MLEGDGVVVAHAHGEGVKVGVGVEVLVLETVVDLSQGLEVRMNDGCVVRVGGHAHDAAKANGSHFLPLFAVKKVVEIGGGEAAFGGFGGDVDFEQYVNDAVELCGAFVDFSEEAWAVNGLDARNKGCDESHLVGLEVTDEMPGDVGGEEGVFEGEFLFTAFAEDALSGMVGGEDVVGVVVFGYGDEGDVGWEGGAYLLQTSLDVVVGHRNNEE